MKPKKDTAREIIQSRMRWRCYDAGAGAHWRDGPQGIQFHPRAFPHVSDGGLPKLRMVRWWGPERRERKLVTIKPKQPARQWLKWMSWRSR